MFIELTVSEVDSPNSLMRALWGDGMCQGRDPVVIQEGDRLTN